MRKRWKRKGKRTNKAKRSRPKKNKNSKTGTPEKTEGVTTKKATQNPTQGVNQNNNLSLRRRVYNWLVRNWLISALIAGVPSICSLVAALTSVSDGFRIFLLCLTIIASGIMGVRAYADSVDTKKRNYGEQYYYKVIDFDTKTNERHIEHIISQLGFMAENGSLKNGTYTNAFTGFIDRAKEFMTVKQGRLLSTKNFKLLVSKSFAPFIDNKSNLSPEEAIQRYVDYAILLLESNDFFNQHLGISVYTLEKDEFMPLCKVSNACNDLPASALNNPKSTLSYVKGPEHVGHPYFESKRKAYVEGRYLPTESEQLDMNGHNTSNPNEMSLLGTIYCNNISLMHERKMIFPLYLCISSYEEAIYQDEDKAAKARAMLVFGKMGMDIKREAANIAMYKDIGIRPR